MSASNGKKKFIYVVLVNDPEHGINALLVRSDHDPSEGELRDALGVKSKHIEATRVDEDSIITLPPKQ